VVSDTDGVQSAVVDNVAGRGKMVVVTQMAGGDSSVAAIGSFAPADSLAGERPAEKDDSAVDRSHVVSILGWGKGLDKVD
jgi:hypothetical protein